MLQLVETASGQFVGHYEEIGLVAGPKLESLNVFVKGNSDGSTIVLALAPADGTQATLLFSGSVSAGALILTGGSANKSVTLKLVASSVEMFNSESAALTEKLKAIQTAQIRAAQKSLLPAFVPLGPATPSGFAQRWFESNPVPPR